MLHIYHVISSKHISTAYMICLLSLFFVLLLDDSYYFYKINDVNVRRRGVSVAATSGTSGSSSDSNGYDLPIYPALASLPTFDEYLGKK